jgi:hypothetical protein
LLGQIHEHLGANVAALAAYRRSQIAFDQPTAASRTLEPNQALILLAARPTGAQWLCPPL